MFDALGQAMALMVKHAGAEKTGSFNTGMLQSPEETIEKAYLAGFRSAMGVADNTKEAAYASQLGEALGTEIILRVIGGGRR